MSWLVPFPILVPFLGAGISLIFGGKLLAQRIIAVGALAITLCVAVVLFVAVDQGPIVAEVAGWAPPIGIALVVDRLSALMLVISVSVTLAVLVYSTAQRVDQTGEGAPVSVFHPTFLILSAGVSNAFLAGDLFNLYVGFEILLFASFVLITLGGTRERMRSGTIYVVVSLVSSLIFLVALAMAYGATGTVNMAHLGVRLPLIDGGTQLTIHLMLLIAFGIKAAVFPLSSWLPDSYPTAPAPVTAVFAGLLTKVGVYAIIRTEVLLFPGGSLSTLLLVVAAFTMVIGILGAVAQDDIKRMLSFTLVSHIGFMIWGIGLSTNAGLGAAIFYVTHHITVQTALFLVAGIMEYISGTTSLTRLGSLLKLSPLLAVLYLIPAFNLSGIPPMTGFLGKAGLIEASADQGSPLAWTLVAAGLVTSFLTLYAMTRAWNMAFWQEAEHEPTMQPLPRAMVGSSAALIALSLALAVGAGPLMQYTQRAALDLRARSPYISAVLPAGEIPDEIYHDPFEAEAESGVTN
ncbi:MAG TPA: Na+/H+ antiporter subunit D [Actinomycetaceae bacterium]|nr:Na+/H+ antiporter subunit D [Actinomycetaceae bacterium]